MAKALNLRNGWRDIANDPPPQGEDVIATNNPDARDRNGRMSHIWITSVYKEGRRFVGFDSSMRKIEGLVAWHSLPDVAT